MKLRLPISALLVLTVQVLLAADKTAWLEKREMFMREAERLQALFVDYTKKANDPAEGVSIPLETYPNGSVKLSIRAKRAQLFLHEGKSKDEGYVWAEEVVITKLDEAGEEISRLEAGRCLIDRVTKCGWASGATRVIFGKTVFTGIDIFFSSSDGYVISTQNSVIESRDMKFGGLL